MGSVSYSRRRGVRGRRESVRSLGAVEPSPAPERRRIRPAVQNAFQGSFQSRQRLQPRGISNMVSRKQYTLNVRRALCMAAIAGVAALAPATASENSGKKFYSDDPLWKEPAPRPVSKVATRQIDDLY